MMQRSVIALFDHVSPSVVQIAGAIGHGSARNAPKEEIQSASGFIWDGAPETSSPTITLLEDVQELLVRFGTGETVKANIFGVAANYDLAVIRLRQAISL